MKGREARDKSSCFFELLTKSGVAGAPKSPPLSQEGEASGPDRPGHQL